MFAAVAVVFGLGLAAMAARTRRRLSVPVPELAARAVAAVYFFILLFVYNRENGALILFSCAFAPPYLALFTTSSDQG